MSETPDQPAETPTKPTGIAWGDPISEERLAVLKELFERQEKWAAQPNRDIKQSIFNGVKLTGADVFWLAALALAEQSDELDQPATEIRNVQTSSDLSMLHLQRANLKDAQLAGANLFGAQLMGANLSGTRLTGADLREAQLAGANLSGAQLAGAYLKRAQLQDAYLKSAQLPEANLSRAHMERTDLSGAHLEGANLSEVQLGNANLSYARLRKANLRNAEMVRANMVRAHLEEADLTRTRLTSANLSYTRLEGAIFDNSQMEGVDLRVASFDKVSGLNNAMINGASLDQVIFDNTNLTVVPWETVRRLGDEREARKTKGVAKKSEAFHTAARAYRSLSANLRNQGIGTDATRFHYRAELMERKSSWWQMLARLRSWRFYTAPAYFGRWLFSWLLGTFAGYGDYFGRLLLTYVLVVSAFAGLMFLAAGRVVSFDAIRDVFVLSVTSFHGRGVQPPGLVMTDGLATLTAVEAFFGLLIEGIFIAAFTRRVTGN